MDIGARQFRSHTINMLILNHDLGVEMIWNGTIHLILEQMIFHIEAFSLPTCKIEQVIFKKLTLNLFIFKFVSHHKYLMYCLPQLQKSVFDLALWGGGLHKEISYPKKYRFPQK